MYKFIVYNGILFFLLVSNIVAGQNFINKTGKRIVFFEDGATATNKGTVSLNGALTGTATSPTIAPESVSTNNLVDLSVTDAKIGETLRVTTGGTGGTVFSTNSYLYGNGTNAFTTVATIPGTDVLNVVKTVQGISPDVDGNITPTFNGLRTGLLSNINAASATVGDFYIVQGDTPPASNGNLYSFSGGNQWNNINFSSASLDARYLPLSGGTLSGNITVPTGRKITLADYPVQAIDAVNKQYVDTRLLSIPVATTTSAGTMTADDKNKLLNFPVSFNTALLNSKLAFWDGLADPALSGNSYPAGVVVGNSVTGYAPSWIAADAALQLNIQKTDINGYINYNFTHLPFMYITFKMKASSTAGTNNTAYSNIGNGVFMYCFADKIPLTEFGSTSNSDSRAATDLISTGYTICFSEYAKRIEIRWGGGPTSGDNTDRIVGGYTSSSTNPGTTNATTSPANAPSVSGSTAGINVADGYWHTVKIFILGRRILVYWDNVLKLNTVDTVLGRDLSNTNFGFVGRTGGSMASHFIKGFSVEHYKEGAGGTTIPEF